MLSNLRLADLRLATAQQRTSGQNLPSALYMAIENIRGLNLAAVMCMTIQVPRLSL
jgi:hypothetical protein